MFIIIMAGGSGTRFWPSSRKGRPKQFLNIFGKDPMVVETCDRLASIAKDEEMALVLGAEHLEEAKRLFGTRKIHMLAEPVGRNTAPCIGLGAIYAAHLGHKGPIAFLPADHFIRDTDTFVSDLKRAGDIAESGGIITLGIVPTRPETGYGYIRRTETPTDSTDKPVYPVSAFVEKPDPEKAVHYLTSGEYFWNAGIFVATAETIMNQINRYLPDLHQGLIRLDKTMETDAFEKEFESVYNSLEAISFDYGIMEQTKEPVYVLPSDCGWSDVGSWESLYELKGLDHDKNRNLLNGNPILIDCEGNFVSSQSERLVACLGIKNCLIVDTPEALLVTDLRRSQDIRDIVKKLKESKKDELL
jgi:mannose-1-phosphate guanylyltransferase